jgi:signal transduction protein with GAF and PtsI domain
VDRDTVTGRTVCDRRSIHVHDLAAEGSKYPVGSRHVRDEGWRTTLATPLMREGMPIGVILVRRMEVRHFSDRRTSPEAFCFSLRCPAQKRIPQSPGRSRKAA